MSTSLGVFWAYLRQTKQKKNPQTRSDMMRVINDTLKCWKKGNGDGNESDANGSKGCMFLHQQNCSARLHHKSQSRRRHGPRVNPGGACNLLSSHETQQCGGWGVKRKSELRRRLKRDCRARLCDIVTASLCTVLVFTHSHTHSQYC